MRRSVTVFLLRSPPMRFWLALLLAVLLPIRGALAATMPCGPAGTVGPAELRMTGAGHDHGGHDMAIEHGGAVHEHAHEPSSHGDGHAGPGHHPDHDPDHDLHHDRASPDTCNACSALCATPPMPSTPAGLQAPVAATAASFPELAAPAARFLSGGQERPPRTS